MIFSIIAPLIMISFSMRAASRYVPTRVARRVTVINGASSGMYGAGGLVNPCPATSSKADRVAGYNVGAGLMAVGTFYGRRYSQDGNGCRYEGGSVGTQGIGVWPKGGSLGAPIDIKSERGEWKNDDVRNVGNGPQVTVIGDNFGSRPLASNMPLFPML